MASMFGSSAQTPNRSLDSMKRLSRPPGLQAFGPRDDTAGSPALQTDGCSSCHAPRPLQRTPCAQSGLRLAAPTRRSRGIRLADHARSKDLPDPAIRPRSFANPINHAHKPFDRLVFRDRFSRAALSNRVSEMLSPRFILTGHGISAGQC
jgi:hypothetical protein